MGRGGRILVQSDVCSGCRACMLACVAAHEGGFGYAAARIRVTKFEPDGLDVPSVCRLCRKPGCVAACPAGALSRDPALGVVRLDEEECIACGACADGCPFGMVIMHPSSGLPLICDLCGGDPACVKRCAPGAIHWGGADEQARERREALAMREGGGARDSDSADEHVGASGLPPARFRADRPPARGPRGGGSARATAREASVEEPDTVSPDEGGSG